VSFFCEDEGTVFVCGSDENYLFGLLRSPRWNPTPLPIALPEKKRIKKIAAYHFQTLAIDGATHLQLHIHIHQSQYSVLKSGFGLF
jgi:hypothetical protein